MLPLETTSLKVLAQTARTQAMLGASAGAAFGLIRGILVVKMTEIEDGYDAAAEGLTQVGAGVILGVVGGVAASVTGVAVTAIVGRGILSMAVPAVASAMISGGAQERVDRLVRSLSKDLVFGVKQSMGRRKRPMPASGAPHLRAALTNQSTGGMRNT